MANQFYPTFISTFKMMQKGAWKVCDDNGFHENTYNFLYIPTALGLIGTEVSEAIAAHRKGEPDEVVADELADIIIRTMDLAENMKIDLGKAVVRKHKFNMTRPFKHGGKKY